jgi:hypothetical protein
MKYLLPAMLLFAATGTAAQEMLPPRISSATVDWQAVRSSLIIGDALKAKLAAIKLQGEPGRRVAQEDGALGSLNLAVGLMLPNIPLSPVPVLLPLDTADYLADLADRGIAGVKKTASYLSGFSASKFFLPGPAGYDAAFLLRTAAVPQLRDLQYQGEVELQISGSAVLYELVSPTPPAGNAVTGLQGKFPGIRRVLHEGLLRYTFVRYGVPYVVSMQCGPRAATPKTVACVEADRVAEYFLNALQIAGGTPVASRLATRTALVERPSRRSPTFTYHPPGSLIPRTGFQNADNGSADRTVYATMRFPIGQTPAFANSQVFMHWGNCFGTGMDPVPHNKGDAYHCRINGRPLRFFEGQAENYDYPWRDNFCEMRDWEVGRCPAGHGHQGQDVRPPKCIEHPSNDARCKPYQHDAVAARDAYVMRSAGQEALFLVVNAPNEHIKFRYLHMSPSRMDHDGMVTNKRVSEGERIGKVGNYLGTENGTSYHLHFDIQVPTRDGWVWVSPYMTLIASYERAIGARGTEVPEQVARAPNLGR